MALTLALAACIVAGAFLAAVAPGGVVLYGQGFVHAVMAPLLDMSPASLLASAALAWSATLALRKRCPALGRAAASLAAAALTTGFAFALALVVAVLAARPSPPLGLSLYGIGLGAALALASKVGKGGGHGPHWQATMPWALLVAAAALAAVTPSVIHALNGSGLGLATLAGALTTGGYQLIRSAMLWVPLGFVLVLTGRGEAARGWALAGTLAYAASPLLWSGDATVAERLELFAALPGFAVGLWLARHLRHDGAAGDALSRSPVRPADAPGAAATAPHEAPPKAQLGGAVAAVAPAPARPVSAVRRLVGLVLLASAAVLLADFPRFAFPLAVAGIVYLAVLHRWPQAWLLVLPAALPALDLAPWTGRFFLDEIDILMLATVGGCLLFAPLQAPARAERLLRGLPALLALSVLTSTLVGLSPFLSGAPLGAVASYWSPHNALRLAKGFVWGYLLFALFVRMPQRAPARRTLALGITLGLGLAAAIALWEFWAFAGEGSPDYRVTGSFSSMHVGGGHIEAYLTAAIPFAWAVLRERGPMLFRVAAGLVFGAAIYAVVTTVARGGIVALVVAFAVLALGLWRVGRQQGGGVSGAARGAMALLAAGVLLLAAGVAGTSFLKARFESTAADAQVRLAHWRDGLAMIGGVGGWTIGEGLGSYPRLNLAHYPDPRHGSYSFVDQGGEAYLRLNSGGDLYMAQHVDARPDTTYRVELDLRSDGVSRGLEFSLCEKKLFNSRRCAWQGVKFELGPWQHRTVIFLSGNIGEGNFISRRPLQFSLYNPVAGTVVDIDNVRMLDPAGNDLLANGDFSRGGERWFFKSGEHLIWHVKSLWVHLQIEQGLLGLIAFNLLAGAAVLRLGRAVWRGEAGAVPWLAALLALLAVGVSDSLVDAPRLTMLLTLAMLIGASGAAEQS